jgi:hypothetical protein
VYAKWQLLPGINLICSQNYFGLFLAFSAKNSFLLHIWAVVIDTLVSEIK